MDPDLQVTFRGDGSSRQVVPIALHLDWRGGVTHLVTAMWLMNIQSFSYVDLMHNAKLFAWLHSPWIKFTLDLCPALGAEIRIPLDVKARLDQVMTACKQRIDCRWWNYFILFIQSVILLLQARLFGL